MMICSSCGEKAKAAIDILHTVKCQIYLSWVQKTVHLILDDSVDE